MADASRLPERAGGCDDGWRFRAATAEDAATLLALYAQLNGEAPARSDEDRAQRFFAQLARYPDYVVWIVEGAAGAPLASYSLIVLDNLAHEGRPFAVVENVVVDANARGRGVGTAMMRHAIERARARGCYKLMLSANRRREAAHAFYESLGFQRHGVSFAIDPLEPS